MQHSSITYLICSYTLWYVYKNGFFVDSCCFGIYSLYILYIIYTTIDYMLKFYCLAGGVGIYLYFVIKSTLSTISSFQEKRRHHGDYVPPEELALMLDGAADPFDHRVAANASHAAMDALGAMNVLVVEMDPT
jgi:hypothetical protein